MLDQKTFAKQKDKTTYKKGSQWRIWDLHIHTPGTRKNDQFEGRTIDEKWKKYIESINNSPIDIAVIGITDYFGIDNYFTFLEKIRSGEITKTFDLVIPNVELRIYPVTGKSKAINIHCLFNPTMAKQIKSKFLSKLEFEYQDRSYNATKEDFIALGRKHLGNETLNEVAAEKEGAEQYVVSIDNLRNIFKKDRELRENTIIVVANGKDGVSGLRDHKNLKNGNNKSLLETTIESIFQFSDAIFSSNKNDRSYFSGQGADSINEVIRKNKTLMPCYHGCDAHENSKVFKPDEERYCWIKSDPTFNGLKQTLYEPTERVLIQPNYPENKTGYQVIDKIVFDHSKIQNKEIELNSGLNCIIGGRSTGKSILLSAITKRLKTEVDVKEENPEYNRLVEDISHNIKIFWKDKLENDEREIEFFNQGYMVQYSRDSNKFDGLVKDILKEKSNGNLFEEFDDFITKNKTEIQGNLNQLFSIEDKIKAKKHEIVDVGDLKGIDEEIQKIEGEVILSKKKVQFSDDEYKKFHEIKDKINSNTKRIEQLGADKKSLESLKNEKLIQDVPSLLNLLEENKNSLYVLFKNISNEFNLKWELGINDIEKNIDAEIETLNKNNQTLKQEPLYLKGIDVLDKNQALNILEGKLALEKKKKEKIQKLNEEIDNLKKEYESLKSQVLEKHKLYFSKADKIAKNLTTSFKDLKIKAYPNFKQTEYGGLLNDSINLRSDERKNLASFNHGKSGNLGYEKEIKNKLEILLDGKVILKNSYDHRNLIQRILEESYYKISYEVTYENDKYSEMSEGKQAFVVLKLLLDFSDKKCPILIDQPEDDLDNRAIYNDLVEYLKNKKKERQIILVTHNPNIVIGTDSEMVIVANQHGVKNKNKNGKKFQYITGSIENTSPIDEKNPIVLERQGIREHVCEILEGGEYAFKKRERRYSIKR